MRHHVPGLSPTGLMSYLAGLGLGRVIALQIPDTEWAWDGDTLVIDSAAEDLADFLVHAYEPTPILSPWNNGSGFAPQDKHQWAALERLLAAGDRLPDWRQATTIARELKGSPRVVEASSPKAAKESLVRLLRNRWPDRALEWLDASVILTKEGPSYPPLLGSGGNDGRLEFSTHFHSNLAAVLPEAGADPDRSLAWATTLLASGPHVGPLTSRPVGQFDAAGAGSPGSGGFGSGRALLNPWAYVLMLEGAVLFAAAPARRLGESSSGASWPFTVAGSPDGPAPGSPAEEVRGEVWVPVWSEPSSLSEIRQVFSEARATWDGSTAKQSAHMYGAVRSFGADRRIDRFVRFGLAQRNGLAFLSVPLDDVRAASAPGIELAIPIARRMDPIRRAESNRLDIARRRADRGLTAFLRHTRPEDLIWTLEALTLWEAALIRSRGARDKVLHGLPRRPPAAPVLEMCSNLLVDCAELRLAAALASGVTRTSQSFGLPTRWLVLGNIPERGGFPARASQGWQMPSVTGLGSRPLVDVLCDAAVWCEHHGATASLRKESPSRGTRLAGASGVAAPWQDTHAWMRGELDEAYLQTAFLAFLSLDWGDSKVTLPPAKKAQIPLPDLSLLQSFNSADVRLPNTPADAPHIQGLSPGWLLKLRAGQTKSVLTEATALLRRSELHIAGSNRPPSPGHALAAPPVSSAAGPRLAAALMAPITGALLVPSALTAGSLHEPIEDPYISHKESDDDWSPHDLSQEA